MGDPARRSTSTNDRDDPLNYVSFDDYLEGAAKAWSLEYLATRWNASHPEAIVITNPRPVTSAVTRVAPVVTPEPSNLTRVFGAVQLLGGGLEIILAGGALLAPEPTGVTKVVGAVVLVHGIDTLQTSIRTIVSGQTTATFTQEGATWVAESAGASPKVAETIGIVTDVGVGVGGTFAVGTLARVGPGAVRLVHLTTADNAAAIRASETLGLGRSTVYAGPASLARARGWSIVARTGLLPRDATDVILLPSEANRAFLVVRPMGPLTTWQRLSGMVFSAGAGSFNLQTGVFTRTGTAANQLSFYFIDSAIMATMRAAPPLLDRR